MDLSLHKSQLNPSKSTRYLFKSQAKLCLGFIASVYYKNLDSWSLLFKKLDTMFVLIHTMLPLKPFIRENMSCSFE